VPQVSVQLRELQVLLLLRSPPRAAIPLLASRPSRASVENEQGSYYFSVPVQQWFTRAELNTFLAKPGACKTAIVGYVFDHNSRFDDDRIRRAVYRAIYSNDALSQYQLRAVPPIHIIVKNGHVSLEGAVARQMDKQVAGVQANSVSGIFSITNNLQVEQDDKNDNSKK
jgi:hypothetical protein